MSATRVELVYFTECPHVEAAREAIRDALAAAGMTLEWREWNRDDSATPEALRACGSPTVLVDGRDVAPAASDAACCRLYAGRDGLASAPSMDMIHSALKAFYVEGHEGNMP
ncbi:MAG: hypothetical protein WCB49_07875 [Gammaproteobacteria bacterium]